MSQNKEYTPTQLHKLQNLELSILKDFHSYCMKHNLIYFGIGGTQIGVVRHQGFIPWDDDIDIGMPRKDFEYFITHYKYELGEKYYVLNHETNSKFPMMNTHLCLKNTVFQTEDIQFLDLPSGIFLDIFPFDNLCSDKKKADKQMKKAWIYSKLLVLSIIDKPNVPGNGIKSFIYKFICKTTYILLRIFGVSSDKLYSKCKKECTKYNNQDNTEYINFICDTNPRWNIFKVSDLYPIQILNFSGIDVMFPHNMHNNLTIQYGDYMQLPPVEKRKNHAPCKLDFGNY